MRFIPLITAGMLSACATVTASTDQEIHIATEPAGATCELSNQVGNWKVESTPATAIVKRSFSPLTIHCKGDGGEAKEALQPQTRGRAYGNILMFGFPAYVDASTGAGYEYKPDKVKLKLRR